MGNENSQVIDLTESGIHEKHENGAVQGLSVTIKSNGHVVEVPTEIATEQNEEPPLQEVKTELTESVELESESQPAEAEITPETPDTSLQVEEIKPNKEKTSLFSKMFKKKAAPVEEEKTEREEVPSEEQTDPSPASDPQTETDNLKQESESLPEPEAVTVVDTGPERAEEEALESESCQLENQERTAEENPVMNFFKTFVTPTKASKKEAPAPDATKDQPQQESQPAAATTVAQVSDPPAAPKGMPVPPPPPPEPPKLDVKADPAAKAMKATPKEPKPAAKDSPKAKSAKDTLGKFFRTKTKNEVPEPTVEVEVKPVIEVQETPVEVPQPVVEEKNNVETQETADVPQPVVEDQKVDASKAATLEAAAKPEPVAPVQEEKKAETKSSFLSFLKPKVLLDHMTATVQAASTSGVRLLRKTTGAATEPKATPAPAAAAEPGPAKEEAPKAAKPAEASAETKPATAAPPAGEEAASGPKKLEKRNSIHLFFKALSQKRHSTDAGAQTEAAAAPSAEKAK